MPRPALPRARWPPQPVREPAPERTWWMGAMRFAGRIVPSEVPSHSSPSKPFSRRVFRRWSTYSPTRGVSAALMQVELARRYSRMQGLTRWDSEIRSSGACCPSRDSTRSSWPGLAMDHRKHTATASTPSATSRSATSTTLASSRSRTMPPPASTRSGISSKSERAFDEGFGVGDAVIEKRQTEPSRFAQHHDVAMALGHEQRGPGDVSRQQGIRCHRSAVNDRRESAEQ